MKFPTYFKDKRVKWRPVVVFIGVMILVAGGVVGAMSNQDMLRGLFKKREVVQSTKSSDITYVDPFDVLTTMKKKDQGEIALIDIRSEKAYTQKYIRGSANVPFSPDKAGDFHTRVEKKAGSKQIVILPHSSFTTRGEQAVRALEKRGMHASLLKVGWNELYNLPNMWLPEEEWGSFRFIEMIEHAN